MLDRNTCESILTIGCQHKQPRGGVAQVLWMYDKYIFESFHKLSDTRTGGWIAKLVQFISASVSLFYKLLFSKRIKIVHIHTSSYNSFWRSSIFVSISKIMRRRVVLHVHGGGFKEFYRSSPEKISLVLNKCDCIIALTESWKSFFLDITAGPDIVAVSNPVEPPVIMDVVDDEKIHMLFLGSLSETKGIYDLLEVINLRQKKYRDKMILHLGGDGEVDKVKKMIFEYSIDDIVKYEGWLEGVRKIKLMNICSVFVLPSYYEGLPVSILEAMSYGEYIISTKVGGIPEIVKGELGVLLNPGDRESLINILDKVIEAPSGSIDRRSIRKEAEKYLPERIVNSLKEIYAQY